MEQQITLADAAAQHHLDGIQAAGIIFGNADHLLIVGKFQLQKLDGIKAGLVADGQAAALVAVEGRTIIPGFHIGSPYSMITVFLPFTSSTWAWMP